MEQGSAERVQRDQPDAREAWEMALRRKKWVRWIVSWLPHQLTVGIRTLLRWEHLVIAKIRHRWRRSLQLRVVGTTLVISATVIAVLGFFLTEQIADGLLLNAENSARTQAITELGIAQSQAGLNAPPPNGQVAMQVMRSIGQLLQPTNGTATYSVAVGLNADLRGKPGFPRWAKPSFDADATFPPTLLSSVQEEQVAQEHGKAENLLYYAPTTLVLTPGSRGEPAIAIGVPLINSYQVNSYQLYFAFPLTEEQQTLHLVQTTLIGVGIALVVLLAAIASLVTRWAVLR